MDLRNHVCFPSSFTQVTNEIQADTCALKIANVVNDDGKHMYILYTMKLFQVFVLLTRIVHA